MEKDNLSKQQEVCSKLLNVDEKIVICKEKIELIKKLSVDNDIIVFTTNVQYFSTQLKKS